MPIVLLIRHAENEYLKKGRLAGRLPGIHLNDQGRQQAEALVETLQDAPLQALYSSPLGAPSRPPPYCHGPGSGSHRTAMPSRRLTWRMAG
jgi:bisphosphoglycerate-dependent phosphoglycerate mutase